MIRFLLILLTAGAARADDWPQWRGPHRDGTSAETGLLPQWPDGGPKLLWAINTLGPGYSGPAVVGDRLYVLGSDGTNEILAALHVDTGRELWRRNLGPEFKNDWGNGPRSTPTVAGKSIVALGAQGVLLCTDLDGKEKWRTDLRTDHSGKLMKGNIIDVDWGYSESPLVDGGNVIVSPGGAKGTVVAFDLKSGVVRWRSAVTDSASYASAVVAEIHGARQVIQLTGGVELSTGVVMKAPPRAIGLNPADGSLLWQAKIHYITAGVINTPVVIGNHVAVSCGYGAGGTILRIDHTEKGFTAVDVTSKDARRAMPVYHGGIVPVRGHLIGYSETNGWVCQSFPAGDELWTDRRNVPGGCHVLVGDRCVIVGTEGTVALAEPTDTKWIVRGEFLLPAVSPLRKANPKIKVCTHPVVSNGRLYVRDQETLYCYDLRTGEGR
jgi:outer membrane protein assembly factor BamB